MSRTTALIAALAILELGICTSPSMSENSSSSEMPANTRLEMPANSESISETAEADKPAPARLIEDSDGGKVAAPAKAMVKPPAVKAAVKATKAVGKSAGAYKTQTAKKDESEGDEEEGPSKEDREQAENSFMSHDDSHPGPELDPQHYYQSGVMSMQGKNYQAALDAFNKALELNPRFHEASYRKAMVYQLAGMDKYAARRYQDVLKYRPDMDEARINLAALHRKHKHYSGAEEQLRIVLAHKWHSYEARYNLANVLLESGKHDEAMKEYKMCLKMKPKDPMVHNNIGVLFMEKNYPDEALQEFKKAALLSPKNQTFIANMKTAQKMIVEKRSKGLTM